MVRPVHVYVCMRVSCRHCVCLMLSSAPKGERVAHIFGWCGGLWGGVQRTFESTPPPCAPTGAREGGGGWPDFYLAGPAPIPEISDFQGGQKQNGRANV